MTAELLAGRLDRLLSAQLGADLAYMRASGIDPATAEACAGVLTVCPVRIGPDRLFDFAPGGDGGAVIEAMAQDAETIVDIIAWPLNDPASFRCFLGAAPALGMAAAVNPATYFGGAPLRLFRTPLSWLQAGGLGAVILDPAAGARWLLDLGETVAAEDDEHAAEVLRARDDLLQTARIVVPFREAAE